MLDRRLWIVNLTLIGLLVCSARPLWWLPLLSLAALLWGMVSRRQATPDWRDWHPVWATLVADPLCHHFARWVHYRKVIGGDSLTFIPTPQGPVAVLLDLSKNDVETLLHFVWVRALLATLHGRPLPTVRRVVDGLQRLSGRVEIACLMGVFHRTETVWQSVGCFGLGWWTPVRQEARVLSVAAKTKWRTRRRPVGWVATTDGAVAHLAELVATLAQHGTPERWLARFPHDDDLTIVWTAPALKLCRHTENAIAPFRPQKTRAVTPPRAERGRNPNPRHG